VLSGDSQSPECGEAGPPEPSPWVCCFTSLVPPGATVLDLACGSGRHSRLFLRLGHPVLAIDRDTSRLADLADNPLLEILACDLESGRIPSFFERRFGGIVVTNYLHRPLFAAIAGALAPGGILLYETFAKGNERFGKPSNPAFLLEEGELLRAFAGRLEVVAYENLTIETPRPAAVQRLCARAAEPSG